MASQLNCPNEEIVFLSATASNRPKSNKLEEFVAKNVNTDLDVVVKREKVYQVFYFLFFYLY
jgi:hypothetical protein